MKAILEKLKFWGQTAWWNSAIIAILSTFEAVIRYSLARQAEVGYSSIYYAIWRLFPTWYFLSATGYCYYRIVRIWFNHSKEQAVSDIAKAKEIRRSNP